MRLSCRTIQAVRQNVSIVLVLVALVVVAGIAWVWQMTDNDRFFE
jgi:hypothetical protein